MTIVSFLQHFLVTVLIAFTGLSNTIAENFPHITFQTHSAKHTLTRRGHPSEKTVPQQKTETTLAAVSSQQSTSSNILLESKIFQQAALGASQLTDSVTTTPNQSRPLTESIKQSLVNIYCQYKTKNYIRTTTGSGFFVSTKGIILTNAHVAQFLLLRDMHDTILDAKCVIRTGDPAVPKYQADLLYVSPTWVSENAKLIVEEEPQGTGERDYALLYVSKSVDGSPLPAQFPALPTYTELLPRSTSGKGVLSAGYPAETLLRDGVDGKLLPRVASTTVGALYTFGSNYADVFTVTNSAVGEQGASGGPIVRSDGSAMGLIVTKGYDTEGSQSLHALTLSYVDRTIRTETGYSLSQNMQGDIAYRGNVFKQALVPFLSSLLKEQMKGVAQ